MSDVKDKELKKLSKEILTKQVEESQKAIQQTETTIARLQQQVQQQIGVLNYAQHILSQFDVPSVPEEKKPLEVK